MQLDSMLYTLVAFALLVLYAAHIWEVRHGGDC